MSRASTPASSMARPPPLTHAAILAYEQERGLPLSAEPSQALLKVLVVGQSADRRRRAPAPASCPARTPSNSCARSTSRCRASATMLDEPDGRLSLELIRAIRCFETDNAAPATGRVRPRWSCNCSGAPWRSRPSPRAETATALAGPPRRVYLPPPCDCHRRCGSRRWSGAVRRRASRRRSRDTVTTGPVPSSSSCSLLDGTARLHGPAPAGLTPREDERRFSAHLDPAGAPESEVDAYMARQISFDPDLWLVEIDDRQGRDFLEF